MPKQPNRYYIQIQSDFGTLSVSWLRQILSDNESLLTEYAKHRFYELHYVLDGSLNIRTNTEELCIHAGEFLLLPPEVYHEITGFAPHTRKNVFGFDIQLTDTAMEKTLKNIPVCVRGESATLRQMAELLALPPTDTPTIAAVQMRCLTEAFFFELLRLVLPTAEIGTPPRVKTNHKSEFMDRIYAVIRSRLGGDFPTVDELADLLHISRRHLSRITVETVKKTPKEILDEERCAYIRELLATTEYSLHEIAFLGGFTGAYSLARFFHAKEGCTPSQYRKDTMKQ